MNPLLSAPNAELGCLCAFAVFATCGIGLLAYARTRQCFRWLQEQQSGNTANGASRWAQRQASRWASKWASRWAGHWAVSQRNPRNQQKATEATAATIHTNRATFVPATSFVPGMSSASSVNDSQSQGAQTTKQRKRAHTKRALPPPPADWKIRQRRAAQQVHLQLHSAKASLQEKNGQKPAHLIRQRFQNHNQPRRLRY